MEFLLNIKGQLNNIHLAEAKALWPLFEAVVNSIQAIEDSENKTCGKIEVYAHREETSEIRFDEDPKKKEETLEKFESFTITDNGVGFNTQNYESFQTAYSTHKFTKGCKGIGRFLWLKAFDSVEIKSTFKENAKQYIREFAFTRDGVQPEDNLKKAELQENCTQVTLKNFVQRYRNAAPLELDVVARKIIEHCLLFFITGNCPEIVLRDAHQTINLNEYYDIDKIDTLTLQAAETRLRADLAPIIDGKTDLTKCTEIDLQKLDAELRMQRIVFEAAAQVYEQMNASWQNQGTKFALLGQVIQLTQKYIESGAIQIDPPLYGTDPVRRRIIYMMNMNRIVQHLWDFIRLEMTSKTVPVFDANRRVRSTADMPTWYTSKPCNITQHSQISHCVYDSGWEATEAYLLEKNEHVKAWAKNDHLGFEIVYVYEGVVRKYIPDYLVKLDNGKTLVLETKGRMTEKDIAKRKALSTWIEAVNGTGEFGMWCNEVSLNVADVDAIIAKQL